MAGRTRAKTPPPLTEVLPVARVVVDTSLAHLNRPFDYVVPADLDEQAQPGVRVRVRFAGRLVSGYLIERLAHSDHDGRLGRLHAVVSAEVVLTPEVLAAARAVAARYAGTLPDVLRLAIPPRHAKVELSLADTPGPAVSAVATDAVTEYPGWACYDTGAAWLRALRRGVPARAVWQAAPAEDWPSRLAEAAATVVATGKGVLLVVPDARDLARLAQALAEQFPPEDVAVLAADLGPAERYRRFLRVRRGLVRVVAGTRSATFAPVAHLGLVVVWADGDDALAEPRAPYPHAREVSVIRAHQSEAALLLGGFGRTAQAQQLVEEGFAHSILAPRSLIRSRGPLVETYDDAARAQADSAAATSRLAPAAFTAIRAALAADTPALVQVGRRGYLGVLLCFDCRRLLRCRHCHGVLALAGSGQLPSCRWCGRSEPAPVCQACGCRRYRTGAPGDRRTAEELGRAFPGVVVYTSSGSAIREQIPPGKSIVIATAGAEPAVQGQLAGYGALILLDSAAMLSRPDLRAAEEALRRWMTAAALVRPASAGGRVVIGLASALPIAQALIRWDAAYFAAAELAARREVGLPPAAVLAAIDGRASDLAQLVAEGIPDLPPDAGLLGPVALSVAMPGAVRGPQPDEAERLLVQVPLAQRAELVRALSALASARSARKDGRPLRIQVDPQAGV